MDEQIPGGQQAAAKAAQGHAFAQLQAVAA